MFKLVKYVLIVTSCVVIQNLHAQSGSEELSGPVTLQQACAFAKENSPVLKNSELDLAIAKKKIWETTAMGLPQVNSKLSGSYMMTMPALIEQFSSLSSIGDQFGLMYGMIGALGQSTNNSYVLMKLDSLSKASSGTVKEKQEPATTNQMRWGLTYDITVSQLLFSGAYLVGLQTASVYKQFAELNISKSENDLLESVTNAYYIVLVAQENKVILDTTYFNTLTLFNQIKELNKQGMVEETDVDQLQLVLSTIENSRNMLARQTDVAKNLLKFQMGYSMEKDIVLADNLDQLMASADLQSYLAKSFNSSGNIDYKLLETQVKLAGLNVKFQKSSFLPDIVAFYQHEKNFNKHSFSFTPADLIGVSVNIPIFGSGLKLAKVKQASLNLEKAKNAQAMLESGLKTSFSEASSNFQTQYASYLTTKQNVALAKKIYGKTLIKYKEGVASSLELTQAQNQYLQAQSNYYTTIMNLNTSKTKLEKLLK